MATTRVSKNLQQGRSGGEGTGYRGDKPAKKSQEARHNLDPVFFFGNSFSDGVTILEANHRGIAGEHRAQCARVRRWREENTLIERPSWGLSNDSGLRMVNWESKSKTLPQSPEDGHIYCILLIRVVFCQVSKNLPLHCLFYVTVNIYFNTAYDVVTGLLIFVNIYHLTHTLLHAHTEAHTHKHTYMISTQEE